MEETNTNKFYPGQLVVFEGYEDVYQVVNVMSSMSSTGFTSDTLKLKNLRTRELGDHTARNCHVMSFLEIMLWRISQSLAADTKTTKL